MVKGKFVEREIIRGGSNRGKERVVLGNEEILGLRSGRSRWIYIAYTQVHTVSTSARLYVQHKGEAKRARV